MFSLASVSALDSSPSNLDTYILNPSKQFVESAFGKDHYLSILEQESQAMRINIIVLQTYLDSINKKIKEYKSNSTINSIDNLKGDCLDLKNNLVIGKSDKETNGEVSKLQQFLGAYKLSVMDSNSDSGIPTGELQPVTGYYGSKTAANVMQWQKAHGMDFVTLTSGVGLMTRGKMKCQIQTGATVKWDIGSKIDDTFNEATVTLSLPSGVVKTTHVNVLNGCKELNQQNLNDEHIKKVNAVGVFDKEPNVIKPGLACVDRHVFSWYGVFFEGGKYFVKKLGEDASGRGIVNWETIKEI